MVGASAPSEEGAGGSRLRERKSHHRHPYKLRHYERITKHIFYKIGDQDREPSATTEKSLLNSGYKIVLAYTQYRSHCFLHSAMV